MKKYLVVVNICDMRWALDKRVYVIKGKDINQVIDKILNMGILKEDRKPITLADIEKIVDLSVIEDELVASFIYYE